MIFRRPTRTNNLFTKHVGKKFGKTKPVVRYPALVFWMVEPRKLITFGWPEPSSIPSRVPSLLDQQARSMAPTALLSVEFSQTPLHVLYCYTRFTWRAHRGATDRYRASPTCRSIKITMTTVWLSYAYLESEKAWQQNRTWKRYHFALDAAEEPGILLTFWQIERTLDRWLRNYPASVCKQLF